jgi:hypothetical protein
MAVGSTQLMFNQQGFLGIVASLRNINYRDLLSLNGPQANP